MRKEFAVASVVAGFLFGASPLQAHLPSPLHDEDTGLSPTKIACQNPFRNLYYRDKVYRSDGIMVAVTEKPLGEVAFISSHLEVDIHPCKVTIG